MLNIMTNPVIKLKCVNSSKQAIIDEILKYMNGDKTNLNDKFMKNLVNKNGLVGLNNSNDHSKMLKNLDNLSLEDIET